MNKFEPLENEVWVDAKSFTTDYSGHYIVSNMGRCWSFKRNKFVGNWSKEHWYVKLSKNGKPESPIMIGRLMLISFGIPIPKHLQGLPTSKIDTMHLDGDSHNNNLSNFAWGSRKENLNEVNCKRRLSEAMNGKNNHMYGKHHTEETKDKIRQKAIGRANPSARLPKSEETKRKIGEARKGEKHPMYGKYGKNNPRSKPILQYAKDGTFIRDWDCAADVQRQLGINQSSISACTSGKLKSAGGYVWRYNKEVA